MDDSSTDEVTTTNFFDMDSDSCLSLPFDIPSIHDYFCSPSPSPQSERSSASSTSRRSIIPLSQLPRRDHGTKLIRALRRARQRWYELEKENVDLKEQHLIMQERCSRVEERLYTLYHALRLCAQQSSFEQPTLEINI
jgi:hypothetical protein